MPKGLSSEQWEKLALKRAVRSAMKSLEKEEIPENESFKVKKFKDIVNENVKDETIYDFVIKSPKGKKEIEHTGTYDSILKQKWNGYKIISMKKSKKEKKSK